MSYGKRVSLISVILCLCMLAVPMLSCERSGKLVIEVGVADSFNTWLATYAIRERIISSPEVNLKITPADTRTYETPLMAGKYPMGVLSNAKLATVQQENIPLVGISTFVVHSGTQALKGVNFVLTSKDSAISSPYDLKGKTVAVGNMSSAATTTLKAFLKTEYDELETYDVKAYIPTPEEKENKVGLEQVGGNLEWLVESGEYEAALIGQNDGPRASKNPALKVIMNLDEIFVGIYGTAYLTSTLVVDKNFQQAHPNEVAAAYELLKESLAYGDEHIDELAPLYADEQAKVDEADFYKMIYNEHSGIRLSEIEGKTREVLMSIFALAVTAGDASTLPDPDVIFGSPYVKSEP